MKLPTESPHLFVFISIIDSLSIIPQNMCTHTTNTRSPDLGPNGTQLEEKWVLSSDIDSKEKKTLFPFFYWHHPRAQHLLRLCTQLSLWTCLFLHTLWKLWGYSTIKGSMKRSRRERHFCSLLPFFYFLDFNFSNSTSNFVRFSEFHPSIWFFLEITSRKRKISEKPPDAFRLMIA